MQKMKNSDLKLDQKTKVSKMGAPKKTIEIFEELRNTSINNYNNYKETASEPLMKAIIYYIDHYISDAADKNLMIALIFGCDGRLNLLARQLNVSVGKVYNRLNDIKKDLMEYSIKKSYLFDV